MRTAILALPLLLVAAPAAAQSAPAPLPAIPPELTSPETTEKLARAVQALSKAMMDLKVGEVQAALEGRQATPNEKRMTVRDLGRKDDPNFERDVQRQIANAGPLLQHSMKALSAALPAVMQGLAQMQQSMDRAIANMPDPNYPKR
ncbi:MAG TPA: hypothetical protein VM308_04560 [Sphingomicrobium sp.]|nr:hypothetical protein [Sphingomicrobium sp.]